jgi:double-strand break repair protein MRE11
MIRVTCRFSQQFLDKVANPREMIVFHRKRQQQLTDGNVAMDVDLKVKVEGLDTLSVGDLVTEYFSKQDRVR